jgi:alpha-methylacyl-CoA racemase
LTAPEESAGPLTGVRVVELAGLGPAPFAAMMLADMGADVIRVDRPTAPSDTASRNVVQRGRRSLVVNLQRPEGAEIVGRLVEESDVLIEGFRPGVAERLGVGPAECLARNPKLVYGRITGWGQDGPLAPRAGHDLNYISLTGLLWGTGRPPDKPVPPLNIYGDYGGGAMFLAFGVVCALWEARSSGVGQVIDSAMVDGAALLGATFYGLRAMGRWHDARGANIVDGGLPHYDVYECADGEFISVAALEPQFYAELVARTEFDEPAGDRLDPAGFDERKRRWDALFRTRTRAEWTELLSDTDACVTPVLTWAEAPNHPHTAARGTYVEYGGVVQPAPAPRFSRSAPSIRRVPVAPGTDTDEVLTELGYDGTDIKRLRESGDVA